MLSFLSELHEQIRGLLAGTHRLKQVDNLLQENPAWRKEAFEKLRKILDIMIERDASDLDIGGPRTNGKIWLRIFGNKEQIDDFEAIGDDETAIILMSVLNPEQKEILFKQKNLDFSITMKLDEAEAPYRFRGNVFFERNMLAANFRLINQDLFSLSSLEIPEMIIKRLNLKYEKTGLFLITGITGSGKSSTLDSIIDMNIKTNQAHVIIIGNPIEYIHPSTNSLVTHREVGEDVISFKKGTYEALRQDPDIIVVGEMRDAATISTVLEVTDSGHKVFSTLHTSSTVESIHRIIAEFPPEEQDRIRFRLADTLKVVISQKLIPNKRGNLTLAKEILSINPSIQAAIRNNNIRMEIG